MCGIYNCAKSLDFKITFEISNWRNGRREKIPKRTEKKEGVSKSLTFSAIMIRIMDYPSLAQRIWQSTDKFCLTLQIYTHVVGSKWNSFHCKGQMKIVVIQWWETLWLCYCYWPVVECYSETYLTRLYTFDFLFLWSFNVLSKMLCWYGLSFMALCWIKLHWLTRTENLEN